MTIHCGEKEHSMIQTRTELGIRTKGFWLP